MSTTITHLTGVLTPVSMEGWEAKAEARSLVHTILGRSDPDITIRPPGLRSGTLTLVFATAAQAQEARWTLLIPQVLTLANADVPEVAMTFWVAGGEVSEAIGKAQEWTIRAPFQEISP